MMGMIDALMLGNKTKKRFPRRIHHTQPEKKLGVMMMTTSLAEEFIILSPRKTIPPLLIPTTVCQHGDDDDSDNNDNFDDHAKVIPFFQNLSDFLFLFRYVSHSTSVTIGIGCRFMSVFSLHEDG